MYLLVTEDGIPYKTFELTDDDKADCDDGRMTIVDLETLQEYYAGAWTDVLVAPPQWGQEV